MKQAIQQARKAMESIYKGICTVYEYQTITDEKTGISSKEEVLVLKDQPCRLSYQSITTVQPATGASIPVQTIKLFIAPELKLNPGSKIVVTQNEITKEYERSGEMAVYATHQEICLKLLERYA